MWLFKPFFFDSTISVGVRDLDQAVAWYKAKLGLARCPFHLAECDAYLASEFPRVKGRRTSSVIPSSSRKDIESACKYFVRQDVLPGLINTDSGGHRFSEFQDPQGNTIEVCT